MTTSRSPDYDSRTDEDPRPRPSPPDGRAPVLEPNEARQGVTHHNVRRVLLLSIAGLVIAYIVVYVIFFR
jgi:hypothetical protein